MGEVSDNLDAVNAYNQRSIVNNREILDRMVAGIQALIVNGRMDETSACTYIYMAISDAVDENPDACKALLSTVVYDRILTNLGRHPSQYDKTLKGLEE